MEKLPDHPFIGAETQIRGAQGRWGGRTANRIAWLAVNGWTDPISIDASYINQGLWPVTDGNHRLAAAVYLGYSEIEADICGFEEDVIRHFGKDIAYQCPRQSKSGPKGSAKCCHFWGWYDCRLGVRQDAGSRAFHRAGGCPDALAREGQMLTMSGRG